MISPLEAVRATPLLARQARSVARFLVSGQTTFERPRPPMPPGYIAQVPGAGDLFYRDTGPPAAGGRGTVLLLHGWMVPSDPHWFRTFSVLQEAGYRVLAIDARGHGRGLRPGRPFELKDCAADAAALIRYLECGPVFCVGYSMGGLIAQLMAKRHPQEVSGAILAATASELRESLLLQIVWSGMGVFQWWLRLAPRWSWQLAVNAVVQGDEETTEWAVGELRRGAAEDIAEAGREIGRFDSRPWLEDVRQPMVVLMTTMDLLVPASRQLELARRLEAPMVRVESDHLAPATTPRRFHRGLCEALEQLEGLCDRERVQLRSVSEARGIGEMFKTIVVGTDGSETAEKAVEEAAGLASATGASVHIVRAVAGPGGDPEGELERAAAAARKAGVEAETHIVRDDASEALIAAAEEHAADLILIGNKGMTGARRFLLGSVPNDVAHHAPCSVLIARTS